MKINPVFYKQIPTKLSDNLRWRKKVQERVLDHPDDASFFIEACRQDPVFFFNGFLWAYDPFHRFGPFAKVPIILFENNQYTHLFNGNSQTETCIEIVKAFESHDLLIEKTRDMLASYLCIGCCLWGWNFAKYKASFLFGSRNEECVDDAGNPKAMFYKLDYMIKNMPVWLLPNGFSYKQHRRLRHIENPENDSVIDGETTTKEFARSDRRTAIILDEFAAVAQGYQILEATMSATPCRIFNSTPKGVGNAFYDKSISDIKKIRLHWSGDYTKSRGMYRTDGRGQLEVLDRAGYPDNYEPILDGKLRSVWYDKECKREPNSRLIAQELDIDYLGSGGQFFNSDVIQSHIAKHARMPVVVGDFDYNSLISEPIGFRENEKGHLRLWTFLTKENEFPATVGKIAVAVDIAMGTGASNSVATGYSYIDNTKVFEYANPRISPEELARFVVSLCKWLGNTYMIFENNGGPGLSFSHVIKSTGFGQVYRPLDTGTVHTKDIGWPSTKETKMTLLGSYHDALRSEAIINRSKPALEETLEYIYTPDGTIEHSRASNKLDPSGAKQNHGDRVIADALAFKILTERKVSKQIEQQEIPYGCLAWRNKMREELFNKRNPKSIFHF